MRFKIYNLILCLVVVASLTACEEELDVTLGKSTPQLTVEGWLSNQLTTQTIRLTVSQDYFNNTAATGASGATVRVTDNLGNTYNFTESTTSAGDYTSNFQGAIGSTYSLYVQYQNEEYQSTTTLTRVPAVDSITTKKSDPDSPGPNGASEGYTAEFFANEIPGVGDNYRIKVYRNGELLNDPQNIVIFQDTNVDGLPFILPIRRNIDPSDGEGYALGDVVKVEVLSISAEAYEFFNQLQTQTTNGGLFADPIANVPSNIVNMNSASKQKAVGFFYASAVSSGETVVGQ